MAKDKTRKRLRKALQREQKRLRKTRAQPLKPGGRRLGFPEVLPDLWDEPGGPDDLDGGAGVREPRHPRPTMPAAALTLNEPEPQYLDLTR